MSDINADQAHGGQPTDSPSGQAARGNPDDLQARIAAAVQEALGPALNAAISNRLKRELPKLRDELATAKQTESDDDATEPKDKAEGTASAAERLQQSEMNRLKKRLEQMEREREQEREQLAAQKRDDALRAVLEKEGVRSTNVALNAVKPNFKVEDGQYVFEGPDGLKTADDYAREFLRENPYLLRPTGKEGGGSVSNEKAAPKRVAEGLTGIAKMAAAIKAKASE